LGGSARVGAGPDGGAEFTVVLPDALSEALEQELGDDGHRREAVEEAR
jgi:two-component system CitB family sensor kinase